MPEKYACLLSTVHIVINTPDGGTMCQPGTMLALFHNEDILVPVLSVDGYARITRVARENSIYAKSGTWHAQNLH